MRLEVSIDGMLAVHARHAVFMALTAVEGIVRADVELGRAEIATDDREPEAAIRAAIETAVDAAGFRVTAMRLLPRTLPTL